MAPRGANPLVLVVDPRRRLQSLLQTHRPVEGSWPPVTIDLTQFLGYLDPAFLADLLVHKRLGKQRHQPVQGRGLMRRGIDRRRQGLRQVRLDVVPLLGDLILAQQDLPLNGNHSHHHLTYHRLRRAESGVSTLNWEKEKKCRDVFGGSSLPLKPARSTSSFETSTPLLQLPTLTPGSE